MSTETQRLRVPARKLLLGVGLLVGAACSHVQPYPNLDTPDVPVDAAVRARVILVGDAGRPDRAVLAALHTWSGKAPERTWVVFLGDNVYEDGLPADPAPGEKSVLDRLIAAVGASHGVFVPGNHDWHGGREGIRRQAAYVQGAGASIRFSPGDGCPGPAVDDAPDGARLVAFDTEWLLRRSPDSSGCDLGDAPLEAIARRVDEVLAQAGDELVVVVAHHPPWSYGPHGGFFDWRDHLFPLTRMVSWLWVPLPVVGSLYPLARKNQAHDQDAYSERYRWAQAQLAGAFAGYSGRAPLIFAGGHDHSLQVISSRGPWDYVLVSGAASAEKLTTVGHGPDTVFAHVAHGFISLDLYPDGRVLLRVIEPASERATFTRWLKTW